MVMWSELWFLNIADIGGKDGLEEGRDSDVGVRRELQSQEEELERGMQEVALRDFPGSPVV